MSQSRTMHGEELPILVLRLAEPEAGDDVQQSASHAAGEGFDYSYIAARARAGRPVVCVIEVLWTSARDAIDADDRPVHSQRPRDEALDVVGAVIPIDSSSGASGTQTLALKPASRTFGWESLRESELGVAELVAHGLTNREIGARLFLSRHTVDSHLRHIFWKLGINSRVELTRLVVEHGVTPGLRTRFVS